MFPPWLFKSRLEERTRPFCCCNGKTKVAECLGGARGGGKMTAVQRNQIKTDNKWNAEEACGHQAEVRQLLTTTHTFTHTPPLSFLSAAFATFLFLSASLYLTFSDSLSSSQTLLQLPFALYEFSPFFHLFQPPISLFLSSVWHFLTSPFFVYIGLSLCLLVSPVSGLFSCLTLYLCHFYFEGIVWQFGKYKF